MPGLSGSFGWVWTCRVISTTSLEPALEELLAKTGFKTVEAGCFFGSHGAFVLSLRFFLEEKMPRRDLRQFLLWPFYTKLARLIASPYFYLVDKLGRGPVVTMTCVKLKAEN